MTVREKDLVLTRVFNLPRERVWKAWTDPKQLALWWGPAGFTNPVCEMDLRPGGALHIDMRGPDGTVYPMSGVFREIVPSERLVFTASALDDKRRPLFEVLNTVSFVEQAGKTRLTVQARVLSRTPGADPYLEGMEAGWRQTLDRLVEHISK
jgi:uncharacterized protein YndB with AHSA1/START domain